MREIQSSIVSYLSVGSNMGDRYENIKVAVNNINSIKGTRVICTAGIYETKPYGYIKQQNFYNTVVKVVTVLEAFSFLGELQKIESIMGRERLIRWGPRIIDIDILLYGKYKINDEILHIPHVDMFNRAFVLIPLKEIYNLDDSGYIDFAELISNVKAQDCVKIYNGLE